MGKESTCNPGDTGDGGSVPPLQVTHSRILAWRIPWTEEPGELESTEGQRVGRD